MNMLSTALLAYLELGLVLAVAYLILRTARRSMQQHIDPGRMIGAGRLLFAAALLAPLAAHGLLSLKLPAGGAAERTVTAGAEELNRLFGTLSGMLSSAPADGNSVSGVQASWLQAAAPYFGGVLLLGLAAAGALALRRVLQLRQIVHASVPLRRIGRVSVVVSDRASVPFSTAIFGRAHVVVPVWMMRDPQMMRVAICHELQHYRRHDPLWSVAFELIRILYFWNPAAYGWTRELSDLQELACDEAVIRRGVRAGDYGNCLLRVAEMAVARRLVASTAMATISDRGAHLRRRIDMLFRNPSPFRSRRRALGLTLIGSFLMILVATTTAANWPDLNDAPVLVPAEQAERVDTDNGLIAGNRLNADCDCDCDQVDCDKDCANLDCDQVKEQADGLVLSDLPNLVFESTYGEQVRLSDLRGQLVLIDFWAEWCKFCTAEAPQMARLHEQVGRDVQILGVSFSKTLEETEAFVEEYGFVWPQLHAEGGWKSDVSQAFGVKGVPARYLIDRDGKVTLLPRGNPEQMTRMVLEAIEGNNVVAAAR